LRKEADAAGSPIRLQPAQFEQLAFEFRFEKMFVGLITSVLHAEEL
jgi:hypothetical protein